MKVCGSEVKLNFLKINWGLIYGINIIRNVINRMKIKLKEEIKGLE